MKVVFYILFLMWLLFNCGYNVDSGSGVIKYVLSYGIEEYTNISGLVYACDDAKSFADLMYRSVVVLRTNEGATKEAISNDAFGIVGSIDEDDIFVFYFAGHGVVISNESYLIPYDGDTNDVSTLIGSDEMGEWFSSLRTRKAVFIFDHCYSGGFVLSLGRFCAMSASGVSEESYEFDSPVSHGIFTYFLLKGMEEQKADMDMDGEVSISELYRYVYPNVTNFTLMNVGKLQSPQFIGYSNVEVVLY